MFEEQLLSLYDVCFNGCNFNIEKFPMKEGTVSSSSFGFRKNTIIIIFNQISFKFHIKIASINVWVKFEYGFYSGNDNQDGRQNVRRLSVPMLWLL